jgi:hypothetical protein
VLLVTPLDRRHEPRRQGVRGRAARRHGPARWCSASSPARPSSCARPQVQPLRLEGLSTQIERALAQPERARRRAIATMARGCTPTTSTGGSAASSAPSRRRRRRLGPRPRSGLSAWRSVRRGLGQRGTRRRHHRGVLRPAVDVGPADGDGPLVRARGMTHYVYAPKDDPSTASAGAIPYERRELAGFEALAAEAGSRSASPCRPACRSTTGSDADRSALHAKVASVLDRGVDTVVLALDDIPDRPGSAATTPSSPPGSTTARRRRRPGARADAVHREPEDRAPRRPGARRAARGPDRLDGGVGRQRRDHRRRRRAPGGRPRAAGHRCSGTTSR